MRLDQRYQQLDDQGREALARGAGISPAYLWQIATHWKGKKPSVDLIGQLVAADPLLTATDLVAEFAAKGAGAGGNAAVSHVSPVGVP